MEPKIKLEFTATDLNLILVSLGQLPYNQVNKLIERIHLETSRQLTDAAKEDGPGKIKQVNTN